MYKFYESWREENDDRIRVAESHEAPVQGAEQYEKLCYKTNEMKRLFDETHSFLLIGPFYSFTGLVPPTAG
jgi:hypothetical protein